MVQKRIFGFRLSNRWIPSFSVDPILFFRSGYVIAPFISTVNTWVPILCEIFVNYLLQQCFLSIFHHIVWFFLFLFWKILWWRRHLKQTTIHFKGWYNWWQSWQLSESVHGVHGVHLAHPFSFPVTVSSPIFLFWDRNFSPRLRSHFPVFSFETVIFLPGYGLIPDFSLLRP